jgi:hypothetical protein
MIQKPLIKVTTPSSIVGTKSKFDPDKPIADAINFLVEKKVLYIQEVNYRNYSTSRNVRYDQVRVDTQLIKKVIYTKEKLYDKLEKLKNANLKKK